jgi:DNA-binding HxlR family transcriptional regulator
MEEYESTTMEKATGLLRLLNDTLASDLAQHLVNNNLVDCKELFERFGPSVHRYLSRLRNTNIVSFHDKLIVADKKTLRSILDLLHSFSKYLRIFKGRRKISPALVIIYHAGKQPNTYSSLLGKTRLHSSTFNRYLKVLMELKILGKRSDGLYTLSNTGLHIKNYLVEILSRTEKGIIATARASIQPNALTRKTMGDLQVLNVVRSLIKYLSHPLRLGIVHLLTSGDMCFEELSLYLTPFIKPMHPTRVVRTARKRHPRKILRWHLNIMQNAGFIKEWKGRYSLTTMGHRVADSVRALFQLDPSEIQAGFPFHLSEEEKDILLKLAHPRPWFNRSPYRSTISSSREIFRALKRKSLIREGYFEDWTLTSLGRLVVDLLQLSP